MAGIDRKAEPGDGPLTKSASSVSGDKPWEGAGAKSVAEPMYTADLYREFESWGVPSKLCRLEAKGLGLDTLVTTCRLPWEAHDLE